MNMLPFSEMPYERPDSSILKAAYEKAIHALKNAASYEEAREAFFELQEEEIRCGTMASLCSVRNTIDTADAFYDEEMRAIREQNAALIPLRKQYQEALFGSPHKDSFSREFGPQLMKLIEASLKTTDERIIEDVISEGEITQQYQKDSAMAKTTFRGEEANFYGLLKHMQSADRAERKEAFIAWANLYESISPALDKQYNELVSLRHSMAEKLGFSSYTDLAYLMRRRFDYTQEDAAAFRAQIKEVVTPAVVKIRKRQAEKLGIDQLHYYDEALILPGGNADPIGDKDALVQKAQQMYRELSKETGEFFDFMVKYELFDLETRPGKRMGGYMTRFPAYKAPFIFSNFNGTSADVDVLTHEAGHAFQGYLAMRSIPVSMLNGSTSEINEIHSMSMEFFAYPWMKSFFGDRSEDYITGHLIGGLSVLPYMCCVDEFQHRVYAEPSMDAKKRRAVWREIEKAYMPWRDYDNEPFLEEGGFWMQKQHIFLYPFYYIDYALAQMGAFHFYGLMKENPEKAWNDYMTLCKAGGTKGYFDLLNLAGIPNPFKKGAVESCVRHVIDEVMARY